MLLSLMRGTMAERHGTEIVVDPLPSLGMGFGLLLRPRGLVVLHASSVDIDGKAVAFVGNPGRGKSTLALALLEQGHKLVAHPDNSQR